MVRICRTAYIITSCYNNHCYHALLSIDEDQTTVISSERVFCLKSYQHPISSLAPIHCIVATDPILYNVRSD